MNQNSHPLAGKTVKIKNDVLNLGGSDYVVEDYWHLVAGKSWKDANGNPAAMNYGWRAGTTNLPPDDEVLYGKIGYLGYLIHISEIEI